MSNSMYFLLGEVFSLLGSICLCYSTVKNKKKKMLFWQAIGCPFQALSNLFLKSYSGIIVNTLTFIRNFLSYKKKLNLPNSLLFCLAVFTLGIIFNNRGIIGLLPVIASIEYTIFLLKTENVQLMRIALIINLFLWSIYDLYIKSYPMFIVEIIIIIVTMIAYYKNKK